MNQKSIGKNFIYNTLLTIVNIIFPLVTAPYLSYVLGADNIGKVNFATAIIGWFILFASFGIPRYGIREVARKRDDKEELSNTFWNLLIIQLIFSFVAIAIYLLMIFNLPIFRSDIKLYLLMLLIIVLNIFSIDWFYQGIEEYGYITLRNIFVKVLSILLIFAFVHGKEHYLLYAAINIFGLAFNNILNYLHIKKYFKVKINVLKVLYYLKELKIYFMTTFTIALYTQLDQVILGSVSHRDLAYYVRSKMVLAIGIGVVNSLITVFIPRTAYLIEHSFDEYKKVIKQSINYIYILALPCTAGIMFLSKELMYLLGGEEFLPASISLQIISVLVLIISIGGWQINQILIPFKLEKLAFFLQCSAALVSILMNIILIQMYSYIGASIAWVIVEFLLLIGGSLVIQNKCKDVKIDYFNTSLLKYIISLLIMMFGIFSIKVLVGNYLTIIIISLIISPILYFGSIFLLREKVILDIISKYRK